MRPTFVVSVQGARVDQISACKDVGRLPTVPEVVTSVSKSFVNNSGITYGPDSRTLCRHSIITGVPRGSDPLCLFRS